MHDDFVIYNGIWVSGASIIHEDDYIKQSSYVTKVPLEGSSGDILFVYDNDIAAYEEYCEQKIQQIHIIDHEVSICDEIFYTTKIEGANTTIARTQAIHNGATLVSEKSDEWLSEKMVQNGFRATKYLNLTQNKPLTKEMLRNLWEITIDGVCENKQHSGDLYRSGYVRVGGHEGVNPDVIENKMDKWLAYYNSNEHNNHLFVKSALLHYTFEDIHPFCDGNGASGTIINVKFFNKKWNGTG